jgi:GT2 family glycosyltransferase
MQEHEEMRVPVYVIHWNAPVWCSETVATLLSSEGIDLELTVIDNASHAIPTLPDAVALHALPRNTGFTGGANRALDLFRKRSEPFCCIASHDVQVAPDALRKVVAAATDNPSYGILGLNGEGMANGEIIERGWISGTFFLLRRECIEAVGDFDPMFGSYVEDMDYSHRAIAAGWKLGIVTQAIATSRGSIARRKAVRLTRANLTLLAAKEGDYTVVVSRLLGMLLRSFTTYGDDWPSSTAYTVRQLVRWLASRPHARPESSAK